MGNLLDKAWLSVSTGTRVEFTTAECEAVRDLAAACDAALTKLENQEHDDLVAMGLDTVPHDLWAALQKAGLR